MESIRNEGILILAEELAILKRRHATLEAYEKSLINANRENTDVLGGLVEHVLQKQKLNQQTGSILGSTTRELEAARTSAAALEAEIRDAQAEVDISYLCSIACF